MEWAFIGNKDNLLKLIDNFQEQLQALKKAIQENDKDSLKKMFIESTRRREKLGEKIREKKVD